MKLDNETMSYKDNETMSYKDNETYKDDPHVLYWNTFNNMTFNKTADQLISGLLLLHLLVGVAGNTLALRFYWARRHSSIFTLTYTIMCSNDLYNSLCVALPVALALLFHRAPVMFSSLTFCGFWAIIFDFFVPFSTYFILILAVCQSLVLYFPEKKINRSGAMLSCIVFCTMTFMIPFLSLGARLNHFNYDNRNVACLFNFNIVAESNVNLMVYLIREVIPYLIILVSWVLGTLHRLRYRARGKSRGGDDVTALLVVGTYLLCNTPILADFVLDMAARWDPALIGTLSHNTFYTWYYRVLSGVILRTCNSALNPCLYSLRVKEFQHWLQEEKERVGAGIREGWAKRGSVSEGVRGALRNHRGHVAL